MKTLSNLMNRKSLNRSRASQSKPNKEKVEVENPLFKEILEPLRISAAFQRNGKSGEDRLVAKKISDKCDLYAVIDGHGGSMCCDFLHKHLAPTVNEEMKKQLCEEEMEVTKLHEQVLRRSFAKLAKEWEEKMEAKDKRSSGAVMMACLVQDDVCTFANVGDVMAFSSCEEGQTKQINRLHRSSDEQEQERISQLGGFVRVVRGNPRAQGLLIPSRVFGDIKVRNTPQGLGKFLAPEPEIYSLTPQRNATTGAKFMVMGTDGFHEFVNEETVNQVVNANVGKSLDDVANALGAQAEEAKDDVSLLIVAWQ